MKNFNSLAFIGLFLCLLPCCVRSQWTNGQNAAFVIGQPDFTTSGASATAKGLNDPEAIAIDIKNNKLYIADGNDNRILRYSLPITANQPAAELVFGQADFSTSSQATSSSGLNDPRGLWVDLTGRLWVADHGNNRVLWFNNAHTVGANAPSANGVLGQSDFTSRMAMTSQNGLNGVCDVSVDEEGTLFVNDARNHRILRFDNAAKKINGAPADGVLGQIDFTTRSFHTTQSGFHDPEGIVIDPGGALWVSDDNNRRVLKFDNAARAGNGAPADAVLGQPDFTSSDVRLSKDGFAGVSGIHIDCLGNLYVADKTNDRVMVFADAVNKVNGADASFVLGQVNFITSGNQLTQSGLNLDATSGFGLYKDQLFIADSRNNRVIVQMANTLLASENFCIPVLKPNPIPTLNEWGLVVLGLILLNMGSYIVRMNKKLVL